MSMDAEYECLEPFDIDRGELDGIPPHQCFTLGVEWQMVSQLLDSGKPISRPIHDKNASRLKRMCIRRNRKFTITPNGPEWKWLEVEGE